MSSESSSTKALIAALQPYGSCDVSDALCRLKHAEGGNIPGLTLYSPTYQPGPTKLIGPIQTVQYSKTPATGPKTPNFQGHYIDNVKQDHVLFINAPKGISQAVYGGIMSTRAKYLGASGTIVCGRIRDLEEHRNSNYTVFARGVGTAPPAAVVYVESMNEEIVVESFVDGEKHETRVEPNDWVVADLNGVVVIPKYMIEKVIEVMGQLVPCDQKIMEEVKAGRNVQEAMKDHRGKIKV